MGHRPLDMGITSTAMPMWLKRRLDEHARVSGQSRTAIMIAGLKLILGMNNDGKEESLFDRKDGS